jgi:hypothetical protein
MRILLAVALVVGIAGTGCVVVPARHAHRSEASSVKKKCPPGHEWSDGRCHSKGKGHDPARREK